jgi:tetratricopeptide (TPR) repeat protein
MLTLGAYTLYTERPSFGRYLAVAGCLALGLMAKPMLVTVPFLLLLVDYWPLDRFRRAANAGPKSASENWFGRLPVVWRLVLEKIPLIALAAVDCKIAMSFHLPDPSAVPVRQLSLVARLANGLISYAFYLGRSFYPVDLAPFYPLRDEVSIASAAGALVLLVAISAWVICCWRRRPYLVVGWLWFLGMLVPVIGLVQFGAHARADRYTYLSGIGLSIALAWGVWSIYRSRQAAGAAPWRGWALAAVSGGAVLALAGVAWHQTSYWRDAETLWTHTIACTEQNLLAHYSLAYPYSRQGKVAEAIDHLREALAADSVDWVLIAKCHGLLGDCLASQGKADEAFSQYEESVRIAPSAPMFHDRLALALVNRGDFDRAIVEWRETIRLNPNFPLARLGLAGALLTEGNSVEAAAQCREVLAQEPDSVGGIEILGAALAAQGKATEALPFLERALKREPHSARVHFYLGLALDGLDRPQRAVSQLSEAIQIQPDNVQFLWHTAWILATNPDPSIRDGVRAVRLATRATQLSGGREPRAFDALAAALAESEKFPAAIEAAERASAAALGRGDQVLAEAIAQRTRLYRQGLPCRQPASSPRAAHTSPETPE